MRSTIYLSVVLYTSLDGQRQLGNCPQKSFSIGAYAHCLGNSFANTFRGFPRCVQNSCLCRSDSVASQNLMRFFRRGYLNVIGLWPQCKNSLIRDRQITLVIRLALCSQTQWSEVLRMCQMQSEQDGQVQQSYLLDLLGLILAFSCEPLV